jgi:hypothetical protein
MGGSSQFSGEEMRRKLLSLDHFAQALLDCILFKSCLNLFQIKVSFLMIKMLHCRILRSLSSIVRSSEWSFCCLHKKAPFCHKLSCQCVKYSSLHNVTLSPEYNFEFLTDPSNTAHIEGNIQNRKGVGDVRRLVSLQPLSL